MCPMPEENSKMQRLWTMYVLQFRMWYQCGKSLPCSQKLQDLMQRLHFLNHQILFRRTNTVLIISFFLSIKKITIVCTIVSKIPSNVSIEDILLHTYLQNTKHCPYHTVSKSKTVGLFQKKKLFETEMASSLPLNTEEQPLLPKEVWHHIWSFVDTPEILCCCV